MNHTSFDREFNKEFLEIMRTGKAAPEIPVRLQRAFAHAAVSILPDSVRQTLELDSSYDLSARGRLVVRSVAKLANAIPDKKSPAAQAALRLGLPANFAWKSRAFQRRAMAG